MGVEDGEVQSLIAGEGYECAMVSEIDISYVVHLDTLYSNICGVQKSSTSEL